MNEPLLTLLASPRHVDLFGLDDRDVFGRLARASSWSETRAVLAMLPSRPRRFTLVTAGLLPPPSLLDGLASHLERLILVPDNWLPVHPRRRPCLRARRAARLAALHLEEPILTVTDFFDDDLPF